MANKTDKKVFDVTVEVNQKLREIQQTHPEAAFAVRRLTKQQGRINETKDETKKLTAQTDLKVRVDALNDELDAVAAAVSNAINGVNINSNDAVAAAAEMFMLQNGDTSKFHRNQAGWTVLNTLVIAGLFGSMGILGMHGIDVSPNFFAIALGTEFFEFASLSIPSIASKDQYFGKSQDKRSMYAKAILPMALIIGAIGTAVADHAAATPAFIGTAAGIAGMAVGGLFLTALTMRFAFMVRAIHGMRKEVDKLDTQLIAIKKEMVTIAGHINNPSYDSATNGDKTKKHLKKEYNNLRTTFIALRKKRDLTASRMKTTLVQALLLLAVISVVATLFVMPHLGAAVALSAAVSHKVLVGGSAAAGLLSLWTLLRMKLGFGKNDAKKVDTAATEAFGEKLDTVVPDASAPETTVQLNETRADKMVPKSPFWGICTSRPSNGDAQADGDAPAEAGSGAGAGSGGAPEPA